MPVAAVSAATICASLTTTVVQSAGTNSATTAPIATAGRSRGSAPNSSARPPKNSRVCSANSDPVPGQPALRNPCHSRAMTGGCQSSSAPARSCSYWRTRVVERDAGPGEDEARRPDSACNPRRPSQNCAS